MLFTCIKSWFFRNHLANFHQISHWSFCWNVIDSLFKWSCSIDCQAHIFFFKTKNCSNDDIFISCDDRIGKMLHNICMSAVAMSLRWANRGPWASCFFFCYHFCQFNFFVPFSLTLSQILSQILAIFCQRIILSEKGCSFIDSYNCSSRFKNQYSVKCVGDLKLILTLIFKTSAVIN